MSVVLLIALLQLHLSEKDQPRYTNCQHRSLKGASAMLAVAARRICRQAAVAAD